MKKDDAGQVDYTPTGSIRNNLGKIRTILIPTIFLRQLADWFTEGATKYQYDNWKKGQPLHNYINSAYTHLFSLIEGDNSENHAIAVAWNICAFIWTKDAINKGILPSYYNTVGHDKYCTDAEYEEWLKVYKRNGISFSQWKDEVSE